MLHPQHAALLEKLKKSLAKGDMTPTDKVGPGTFVCVTEATPMGMGYNQLAYDDMPFGIAELLDGKRKGDKVGTLKIVAVYDVWPAMETKRPPVQVFDN